MVTQNGHSLKRIPGTIENKGMRLGSIVLLVLGVAVVGWLVMAGGSGIPADARVQVLTTDPIRVLLPVDAGSNVIEARLRDHLATAATSQRDTRMGDHMRDLAGDSELMTYIADSGYEQFDSDLAAGIAYGLYDVDVGENVLLYSVTVELLPSYYNVGEVLDHEDGHWIVNSSVAQRCGPKIVRDASGGSIFPGQARFTIITDLQLADHAVHTEYHRLVLGATAGQHRVAAQQALDTVIGPACERWR